MHILQTELQPADEGQVVLILRGEIDISVADDISEAVALALSWPDCHTLEVDLSEVGFIDSTGLGALIAARNKATSISKAFRVRSPSDRVQRVFDISGLGQVFGL